MRRDRPASRANDDAHWPGHPTAITWAGECEIGSRSGSRLARSNPVELMRALVPRQRLRGGFRLFPPCRRDELGQVHAGDSRHQGALRSVEDRTPLRRQACTVAEVQRPGRLHALVPAKLHGREAAAGGELERDHGRQWMNFRGRAAAGGVDARGCIELQRGDDGVERVHTAISHHATAKIPPAPPGGRVIGRW